MAYIIANMRELDIKYLIECREKYPDKKIDLEKLKQMPHKDDQLAPLSEKQISEVFIHEEDDMIPILRKR